MDALALIAADSAGLADAAEGNLAAPVEHCPGWTVADLVHHVYGVHRFWGEIVARRLLDAEEAEGLEEPERPADLIDTFRANAAWFVDVLREADPSARVWTWSTQHNVAFVIRHQVQEAAVHRWDAEHAAGRPYAIDRDAAVYAIDEALTFSVPTLADHPDEPGPDLPGPLVLAATDAGVSWTIRADDAPGTVRFEHADEPGAARVTGTASDLLLWLYERVDLPATGPNAEATVQAFHNLGETG